MAVEIALRLRAAGEPVAFFRMIDTRYPGAAPLSGLPKPLRWIEQLGGELTSIPREQWRSHLPHLPFRALRRCAGLRKGAPDKLRAAVAMNTRLKEIFFLPPARFDGRLTLFAAEESEYRGFHDRRLHGSRVAAEGLELHLLPGTHNLMSQEPLLGGFAETWRGCLERARRPTAALPGHTDPGDTGASIKMMGSC